MFRLYKEPEYGQPRPEVSIDEPQLMDMENPTEWRIRENFKTIAELTGLWQKCNCFNPIMEIKITDVLMDRPDGAKIPIRIYHPEGDGPHPIMLFIHGGGWSMNNIDVYDAVTRYIAKYGKIAVLAVEYRLAPEYKFPTGLEDCYAAFEWAVENAESFNGSASSVTICGDSAGGNLTAAISLMARDKKGPKIHKQAMIFPCVTFHLDQRPKSELMYGNGGYFISIDSTKMGAISQMYLNNENEKYNPYVSPLLADDLKDLPPASFFSAECDPLLDQGLMYAAALEDNGNEVDYHIYTGMLHAFLNRTYQKTFECLDDIIACVPPVK